MSAHTKRYAELIGEIAELPTAITLRAQQASDRHTKDKDGDTYDQCAHLDAVADAIAVLGGAIDHVEVAYQHHLLELVIGCKGVPVNFRHNVATADAWRAARKGRP